MDRSGGIEFMNIILITLEGLRSDKIDVSSHVADKYIPNLNRLKKNGVFYTDMITAATFTFPSLASILCSTFIWQEVKITPQKTIIIYLFIMRLH